MRARTSSASEGLPLRAGGYPGVVGLLIAILILAALLGIIGRVLKFALWLIVVLAIIGAVLGALVYYGFRRVNRKI